MSVFLCGILLTSFHFSLSNNKIGAYGITAMAEALECTALTTIKQVICMSSVVPYKELAINLLFFYSLCGNPISDEGTLVISKHIQRNWKVETLL